MVKIEGKICSQTLSILIDHGSSLSYILPVIVEKCKLTKNKLEISWLVQLATGTKREVVDYKPNCHLDMNGVQNRAKLNLLPLSAYDVTLICMDRLATHRVILNCHHKTFHSIDEDGNQR